ncbi:hypothetical protein NLJ89_g8683 [Agrocybe chaxingu]|uniref:Uncharacterized protein n=1 Tax=Agrocybe chaxingu TaxID=84603 RepID=A0A9W8JUF0_9AGAR|nr:hypothetical protein NLJ89_g8683 [Agrocybe chaxingu]
MALLYLTSTAYPLATFSTGYLVDLFCPEDPVSLFSNLITSLRASPSTGSRFSTVLHIYEPVSEQSFFVNSILLAQRLEELDEFPIFLRLGSPIEVLQKIPDRLNDVLHSLRGLLHPSNAGIPLSYTLPADIPMDMTVALAGVLLDYAVAYMPIPSREHVLSGVPLDFYKSTLTWPRPNADAINGDVRENQWSIMKFSCPAQLAENHPALTPTKIINRIQVMFQKRLSILDDRTLKINTEHTTKTLAHVAF